MSGRDKEENQQCSRILFQTRSCISKFLQYFVIKRSESAVHTWNWCVHMAGDISTVFSAFAVTGDGYLSTKTTSSRSMQRKWALRNVHNHFSHVFFIGNNPEEHSRHSRGWESRGTVALLKIRHIAGAGRVPGGGLLRMPCKCIFMSAPHERHDLFSFQPVLWIFFLWKFISRCTILHCIP